ncbi:MAG: DUF4139 domain-containing protein, partial [Pseudomonadota bacterium]
PAPPPPRPSRAPAPPAACMEEVCAAAEPLSAPAPRSASIFARSARKRGEAKSEAANRHMDMPEPELECDIDTAFFQVAAQDGAPPPEQPPGLAAADSLLAYDALWMPGPEDHRRGRLRSVAPELRERADLPPSLRERLPTTANLQRHLTSLLGTVQRLALPAGHLPPRRGAFDHAWRSDHPVDVPGDGRFHSVAVFSASLPARMRYITVPREAREVFRALRLDNTLPTPLLEGPVEVDLGHERLPTARLPQVSAGGHCDLGLGVEEGLKLARNTRFSEQSRGMVSRHLELQHEIEIELRSLLPHVAELEVRERLPMAREGDEEIKVAEGRVDPPWEAWEPEDSLLRGGRRWQLSLPAGEVRRLRAAYTISISAKHELVGGNRREG